VLLRGRSGAGKSDLALRLIDRGWMLVADDYVVLREQHGIVIASAPPRIAGMIEVRGVGLIPLPALERAPLCLVVDLDMPPQRIPEPAFTPIAGHDLPCIALSAMEPSAPIKVEHSLRLHGVALNWGMQ